ncbi:MAG: tetratricopeptide repeat protein [Candidatus Latescibacteria bacterium]|nr:tetratricopeptide repeat protein [Candidatus Latescibacterota bacterium]
MVADHPLLGVGPGGWIRAYPPYDGGAANTTNMVMNTPHNDYLWIASEGGLLGLGVYLWFLGAGLGCLLKMAGNPDPSARIAAWAFALSLLSTLFDAFFNFPKEQPQAAMFLYLLFGVAASATAGARGRPPIPSSPTGAYRGIAFRLAPFLFLLVSLTALVLSLCRIGFDWHYLRAMASASRPEDRRIVLAEAQRALDYGTFRPHLLNLKGNALENLGRYAEAESAYRQALALAPHSWHAHNGLCAVAVLRDVSKKPCRTGRPPSPSARPSQRPTTTSVWP